MLLKKHRGVRGIIPPLSKMAPDMASSKAAEFPPEKGRINLELCIGKSPDFQNIK
jgi:hypothetical protein